MDHETRRDKVRKALRKLGVDALLVTDFTNVTYLTGFTGDDSYLLVRDDGDTIISDPRYTIQLGEEAPGVDLFIRKPGGQHFAGHGAGAASGEHQPAGHRGRFHDRRTGRQTFRQTAAHGDCAHLGIGGKTAADQR